MTDPLDSLPYRSVAVDFHGTLSDAGHAPQLGKPHPGAIKALKAVQKVGGLIYITCGGFRSNDKFCAQVKDWLREYGLDPEDHVILRPSLKIGVIVDDRARRYDRTGKQGLTWADLEQEMLDVVTAPDADKASMAH